MLDINQYFFWQLANFILLFFILNTILFKPFIRLFKERDDSTRGALESAKEMDKEKEAVLAQVDEKLAGARTKARKIFEELSNDGMDTQRAALEAAQNESVDINRKAKEDLQAATEKARTSLKADIDTFAKQIVEKLIGA